MNHRSVLLHEAIASLAIVKGDTVVDGTVGSGGHLAEMYKLHGQNINLVGLDADPEALTRAQEVIGENSKKVHLIQGNFRNIDEALKTVELSSFDKALLDLGWSTDQFERSGRGFSFKQDEPLDMRFDPTSPISARNVVNDWQEETLRTIIKGFGEEKFARVISHRIVTRREHKPIETTAELAGIIYDAVPSWYRHRKIHPATKTFQALRIAVNDELSALEEGLAKMYKILNTHGRIAVITFHSLEDRIVKRFFRKQVAEGNGKLITKKPITPSDEEIETNRRSRSAKLRIIEKTS